MWAIWPEKKSALDKTKQQKIYTTYGMAYTFSTLYMQNVNDFHMKICKIREIFNVYCNFACLKV